MQYVMGGQVHKLSEAGCVYCGKTVVNEFGIGAVEMTVQPEAVLNPWYSADEKSSGIPPTCFTYHILVSTFHNSERVR